VPTIDPHRQPEWWARFALPTLVLARWFILTSFHEEWPSPGGRSGWAAD
jgi:hypothetical protein